MHIHIQNIHARTHTQIEKEGWVAGWLGGWEKNEKGRE